MTNDLQRTDDWRSDRKGKVTASKAKDVCKRQKNGSFYAARDTYLQQIVHEILTGEPAPSFTAPALQHGIDNEEPALNAYAKTIWTPVVQSGFVTHPNILRAGASPDGLVGDDGLVEIKCPHNGSVHVGTLIDGMPEDHNYQIQLQLACTGREWCDFVSYDPRLPEEYQLYVQRVERDPLFIATMEEMIIKFLAEVDETVEFLQRKYKKEI